MKIDRSPAADEEFRRRVLEARAMAPEEKMAKGIALWEAELVNKKSDISAQHPNASAEDREKILSLQLENERREEEEGIYFPVPRTETQS